MANKKPAAPKKDVKKPAAKAVPVPVAANPVLAAAKAVQNFKGVAKSIDDLWQLLDGFKLKAKQRTALEAVFADLDLDLFAQKKLIAAAVKAAKTVPDSGVKPSEIPATKAAVGNQIKEVKPVKPAPKKPVAKKPGNQPAPAVTKVTPVTPAAVPAKSAS